ncbi:hypothetical protein DK41_09205 [Streptococcus agalactiae]|nr:hypothetical protein DK41_09205 [Streptococcus agalactiae]
MVDCRSDFSSAKLSGLIPNASQILKIVSAFAFITPRSKIERIVVYGISFSIAKDLMLLYLLSITLFKSFSFIFLISFLFFLL